MCERLRDVPLNQHNIYVIRFKTNTMLKHSRKDSENMLIHNLCSLTDKNFVLNLTLHIILFISRKMIFLLQQNFLC